jgi:L-rhamnose mutarotase
MSAPLRRVCQTVQLRPELLEEYLGLHRDVWDAVQSRLRASHITNYSIFRRGLTLIGYYEYRGTDYDADLAAIAADPETQRWWALTAPCQLDVEPGA